MFLMRCVCIWKININARVRFTTALLGSVRLKWFVEALTLTGLTVILQLELRLPRNGFLLSSIAKGL